MLQKICLFFSCVLFSDNLFYLSIMKAKQKRKHKDDGSGSDKIVVSNSGGEADAEASGDDPDPDFETVLKLLHGYLEMLTLLELDQSRDIVNQGNHYHISCSFWNCLVISLATKSICKYVKL